MSATTPTLEEAIRLNNKAASLFHLGRFRHAVSLLQDVLAAMNTAVSCHQEQRTFGVVARVDKKQTWRGQDGAIYMHDRPLILSTDIFQAANHPDRSDYILHVTTMYVTFNLALAYQLYGVVTGTEVPWLRAMELYQRVLTSHNVGSSSRALLFNGDCGMSSAVWDCLVLTNLAHIHYEFCDYNLSQYYMMCVADIVNHTDCLSDTTKILDEREVGDITLNLFMLRFFPLVAEAA